LNENQRIVALSIIIMLVSSELIDRDTRMNMLEKFVINRIHDQNLIVKRLVIRGVGFIVDKVRSIEIEKG